MSEYLRCRFEKTCEGKRILRGNWGKNRKQKSRNHGRRVLRKIDNI